MNLRPLGYEPNELPDCSTPRYEGNNINAWRRPTLAGAKPQLPSALKNLTSVFDMGTGVTSSLLLPDNPKKQGQVILYAFLYEIARFFLIYTSKTK